MCPVTVLHILINCSNFPVSSLVFSEYINMSHPFEVTFTSVSVFTSLDRHAKIVFDSSFLLLFLFKKYF